MTKHDTITVFSSSTTPEISVVAYSHVPILHVFDKSQEPIKINVFFHNRIIALILTLISHSSYSFHPSYSNSIASGLVINGDNYVKLVEGHNPYWFNMKRQIKNHLLCGGELSSLHFDALKVSIAMLFLMKGSTSFGQKPP